MVTILGIPVKAIPSFLNIAEIVAAAVRLSRVGKESAQVHKCEGEVEVKVEAEIEEASRNVLRRFVLGRGTERARLR
jgi:hypothetical protein